MNDEENSYIDEKNVEDGMKIFNSVERQTDYDCEACKFEAVSNSIFINHISSDHKKIKCWKCNISTDHRQLM